MGHLWETRAEDRPLASMNEGEPPAIMIDRELLELLVCPENHMPLHLADEGLIGRLNQAIAAGQVRDQGGEAVQTPIEGGLVREDGKLIYPVQEGIPVMLVERAISLEGL